MQRDGGGDHRIQDAFGDLVQLALAIGIDDGGVGHQMTDVAHEHERAAVQLDLALARGRGVDAITVEAAGEGLAALGHLLSERALQDAQPVAVGQHFVLRIDHGHRVFEVENGRQRRLDHQIADPGRVFGADGRAAVDADVQVQSVVHQQHRARGVSLALIAHQLLGIVQAGFAAILELDLQLAVFDAIAHRVDM